MREYTQPRRHRDQPNVDELGGSGTQRPLDYFCTHFPLLSW
jgi:hypothetical protein